MTLPFDHIHDLDLWVSRSEYEMALSQEWDGRLTCNEKDISHPFMTMILTTVIMVGWADVLDSARGDFRRRHAVDISIFFYVDCDGFWAWGSLPKICRLPACQLVGGKWGKKAMAWLHKLATRQPSKSPDNNAGLVTLNSNNGTDKQLQQLHTFTKQLHTFPTRQQLSQVSNRIALYLNSTKIRQMIIIIYRYTDQHAKDSCWREHGDTEFMRSSPQFYLLLLCFKR